jgi:hypothetical protein
MRGHFGIKFVPTKEISESYKLLNQATEICVAVLRVPRR